MYRGKLQNQFRSDVREESRYVDTPSTGPARREVLCELGRAYTPFVGGIGGAENQLVHFLVRNRLPRRRRSVLGRFGLNIRTDTANLHVSCPGVIGRGRVVPRASGGGLR